MNYIRNSASRTTVRGIYGNIMVELSIDNGLTYSYTLVASYNCGDFDENNPDRSVTIPINLPNLTSNQCYFRYTSLDVPSMIWLSNRFGIVSPAGIAIILNDMSRRKKKKYYY